MAVLAALGILGAALFFGDSMIDPYVSADVADYFRLPRHRTVVLGERIEV
ncbi:hypothetical protein [Nocardia sp. NPDC004123]